MEFGIIIHHHYSFSFGFWLCLLKTCKRLTLSSLQMNLDLELIDNLSALENFNLKDQGSIVYSGSWSN